jgi:hypothetical protein
MQLLTVLDREPFIDFPPSNSFCRMLMHKLADYYHMTHQFDPMAGSVRIFRTPFCRLPQSLTSLSNPPTTGSTPPPTVPVMKIMRRGEDNASSPSKPTSENGSDNKDKSLSAKEKYANPLEDPAMYETNRYAGCQERSARPPIRRPENVSSPILARVEMQLLVLLFRITNQSPILTILKQRTSMTCPDQARFLEKRSRGVR